MKQRVLLATFTACLFAAGPPALAASDTCTSKDPRVEQLLGALSKCVANAGEPLYLSDKTPEAVADEVMAGCASEQAQLSAFTRACRAQPPRFELFRQSIAQIAENRRARSDVLWNQGAWAKGACSMDDPAFAAAMDAHLRCTIDAQASSPDRTLARIAAFGVAQCVAKEAPIAQRLTGCQGAKAAAIMGAYRAFAQEYAISTNIDPELQNQVTKDTPAALADPHLRRMRNILYACVLFEVRKLAPAPGEEEDAVLKARAICSSTRVEIGDYARRVLSPADGEALLSQVDAEATGLAETELGVASAPGPAQP